MPEVTEGAGWDRGRVHSEKAISAKKSFILSLEVAPLQYPVTVLTLKLKIKMPMRTNNFLHRPLNRRAKLILVVAASVGLLMFEAWLGRKRLLVAHDRQYQLAFILFFAGGAILLGALKAIGARARTAQSQNMFTALQVSTGVLSFLSMLLVQIFSDYSSSSLNADSVVDAIAIGAIFAVWNAMSMRTPVS